MRIRLFARLVLTSTIVVLLSIMCLAQSETGSLAGVVSDPKGAVVPDADVTATRIETNITTVTKTNRSGVFAFSSLQPGHYRVLVRATGFKEIALKDVELHIQDKLERNFSLEIGTVSETVNVEGGITPLNTQDASVSTVVDRQFAENLPMNGRSFQTLIELTPGVVLTPTNPSDSGEFSINGQRASSNYWMVDGVSANFGMSTLSTTGNGPGGSAAALTAQGGTNGLVSVDALQEFRIQTSTYAPEFGRTPGGQISILTRSGSNQFHGSAFDYLRNDILDANDWFADNAGLPKPKERQNDFGGTVGGPILKDRTFFFFSYEGLRLRLPQVAQTIVPSLAARQNAIPIMQPFLNAFPLPNGPAAGVDQNEFNASFSDKSTLDATSLRLDHQVSSKLNLFARYNYSPSSLEERLPNALSSLFLSRVKIQTATIGATWTPTSSLADDFRFNYSRTAASNSSVLDNFGGAVPLTASELPLPSSFNTQNAAFSLGVLSAGSITVGAGQQNLQQQTNLVDNISLQEGSHALRFGVDYRHLFPSIAPGSYEQSFDFIDTPSAESGSYAFGSVGTFKRVNLRFNNLGVFAQDTWRIIPRLTLTYGLRWDVDFAPSTANGPDLAAATGVDPRNLSNLALAPDGTPIFNTRYGSFAPRIGAAYQLSQQPGHETVLRGGFGVFYDLATQEIGSAIAGQFPFAGGPGLGSGTFPPDPAVVAPPVISSRDISSSCVDCLAVQLFDPKLKLPYTLQWNAAIEQSLGTAQSLSASYVGSSGRRLIQTLGIFQPNSQFFFPFLVVNAGSSNYNALQIQFQRRLSHGLQALASYTWSHSVDTGSASSSFVSSNVFATGLGASENRGPSSFDARHAFSAAATWDLPAFKGPRVSEVILNGWSLENILQGRTALPVDVQYSQLSFIGFQPAAVRPDLAPGQPLDLADPTVAGGRKLNPAAFAPPPIDPTTGSPTRQGDLGRNALRGFDAFQWDFAVHRAFPIHEQVKLQFRAELFNLLNHPNFANPIGDLGNPQAVNPHFGQSTQMLGRSLAGTIEAGGGLSPLYQIGGPRSVQLALKLTF